MKKCAYVTLLAAVLLASAVVVAAQADQNSPFYRNMETERREIEVQPRFRAPKSETVTIAPDGKSSVEEVDAQGKTTNWSFTPSGDTAVPIEGMENSTVIEKVG